MKQNIKTFRKECREQSLNSGNTAMIAYWDEIKTELIGLNVLDINGNRFDIVALGGSFTFSKVINTTHNQLSFEANLTSGAGRIVIELKGVITNDKVMFDINFSNLNGNSYQSMVGGYLYEGWHWYSPTKKKKTSIYVQYDIVRFARRLKVGGNPAVNSDYDRWCVILHNSNTSYHDWILVNNIMLHSANIPATSRVLDFDIYTDASNLSEYKIDVMGGYQ